jgi:hypothetical protein
MLEKNYGSHGSKYEDYFIMGCNTEQHVLEEHAISSFRVEQNSQVIQLLSIKLQDCKKTLEHILLELPNIYISREIKSASELYGQRLYMNGKANIRILSVAPTTTHSITDLFG